MLKIQIIDDVMMICQLQNFCKKKKMCQIGTNYVKFQTKGREGWKKKVKALM